MKLNVSMIADEVKINEEIKEQAKLALTHSKEIVELEKKKSEIMPLSPEALKPIEKDEVIRRASS